MIQRLQSLWLLLAAVLAFLSFLVPFYSGTVANPDGSIKFARLNASYYFLILVLTGVLIAGCLILIFLYKDRKLQLKLTILAFAISAIIIILYFTRIKEFVNGNLSFAAIITLAIPVVLLLAARGIWQDEKLVKSLDRLR